MNKKISNNAINSQLVICIREAPAGVVGDDTDVIGAEVVFGWVWFIVVGAVVTFIFIGNTVSFHS